MKKMLNLKFLFHLPSKSIIRKKFKLQICHFAEEGKTFQFANDLWMKCMKEDGQRTYMLHILGTTKLEIKRYKRKDNKN